MEKKLENEIFFNTYQGWIWFYFLYFNMAHKKAAWSAKNLRDSKPKYRWVKVFGWQLAKAWNIILRQKGMKYRPWKNVYISNDFSIHAKVDWIVFFTKKKVVNYNWRKYLRTFVHVKPQD